MTDRLSTFLKGKGLQLRKIDEDHYVDFFDCGRDHRMTKWFCDTALKWQNEDMCSVWVLSASDNPTDPLGFFTLSSHQIVPSNVHKNDKAADPSNKPWVNGLDVSYPAQLLGKFALDQSQQGKGLANPLMLGAYAKHLEAADVAGAKFLLVDVQDDRLISYYRKNFQFIRSQRVGGMAQLYRPTSIIRDEVESILS